MSDRTLGLGMLAALALSSACGKSPASRMPPGDTAPLDAGNGVATNNAVPPSIADAASNSGDAGSAAEAALPPLRWGTRPNRDDALSYVIDGYCVQADVDLLDNATLIHYGEHGAAYVARVTDAGLSDWDRMSKGIVGYYFRNIEGTYPDNLWFGVDNGGRAFTSPHYLRFDKDHWGFGFGQSATSPNQAGSLALVGGGAVAVALTCGDSCSDVGMLSDGVKAPPLTANGFATARLYSFASGDIWAFGHACADPTHGQGCVSQARRWKPESKVAVDYLGGDFGDPISVIGKDPSDVTISVRDRFLHFDGVKWEPLTWTGKNAGGELHAAPDGTLYALKDGKLERRAADGTVHDVGSLKRLKSVEGIEVGALWAVGEDGTAARWEESDAAFKEVVIPKSPFAWVESKKNQPRVERIRVRSARDVWFNVKYIEWPSHYGDQQWDERRALLRTIPPNETLRCKNWGAAPFESFPPLATPACPTPMVILANVDATQKTDYPGSRKLVKGKKELDGTRYVEFTVDKQKVLGARVPSFDVGKKLLSLMRANIPYVRPEMVCADPPDAKEISLP